MILRQCPPASIGSRPRFRTALPRLTAGCPHRDGSTGMRWWRVPVPPRPLRSCKDQMHPCALPVMVSRVSAALTSPAFQTDAFTGLAFWTRTAQARVRKRMIRKIDKRKCVCSEIMRKQEVARTSGIEPLSMRGQRMALPIYQVRKFGRLLEICRWMVGNRGIEPRMRTGAGFTGPLSHQTWRYPKCLESLPYKLKVFAGRGEFESILATTIGLEPTSSTFGRSCSSS